MLPLLFSTAAQTPFAGVLSRAAYLTICYLCCFSDVYLFDCLFVFIHLGVLWMAVCTSPYCCNQCDSAECLGLCCREWNCIAMCGIVLKCVDCGNCLRLRCIV